MKRSAPPNLALQRERFRQQMTRAALARQTHISRKCLWEIESKGTNVRMDTAGRIASALGVEIETLFRPDQVIG